MVFFGESKFTVVSCFPEMFRGAVFGKRNSRWTLLRKGCNTSAADLPGDRLKALLKEIGYSGDSTLFITGDPADSCFFTWESVPLPPREQRGAVEMQLTGALPGSIEEPVFQFMESPRKEDGSVTVGVYVFPVSSLYQVVTMLNRSGYKADEFVSPLMGVEEEDPPVHFPSLNRELYFHKGVWRRSSGREKVLEEADGKWREIMRSLFVLPEDFSVTDFIDVLLVARLECSGLPIKERPSLRLLPDPARPLRYRTQLQLGAALLVLLAGNLLWSAWLNFGGDYRASREIAAEIDACRRKISSIQSRLKRNQKAIREMTRVIEISAGESDVIGKLAAVSRLLPDNVLVSSMRWSDSGLDLQLQSENANINLPVLFKPLTFWKVANLQQRQMWNSDVTSINLRLVPSQEGAKAGDGRKKSSSSARRGQTGGVSRRNTR